MKGDGLGKIANNLNKEKIPSPLEYKKMNGSKLQIPLLKEYLDYDYIEKAGTYIVSINICNNETQILNNLISFNYITTDKINFNNKCEITLKRYTQNKTKIYYSEKTNLDINNFNEEDFILLNEEDSIPKTATCIATYTKELDRTHGTYYQFEITLKENISKERFYFMIKKTVSNIDVDLDFKINIRRKLKWSSQTIKTILEDEVYIGNMVQFKTTTVSYKNHTVIHNDNEDRIRKNGTHIGIVDKTIWYTIQKRLKDKTRSCINGKVHTFSNKVFCMSCNRVFCKCGKKLESGYSYLCCKDKKSKWSNCDNKKYLREEELHNLVLEKINILLDKFYDEKSLNDKNNDMIEHEIFKDKIKVLENELNNTNKLLQNKSLYFQRLYEDRNSGILSEKEFLILMNKYKDDTLKLENRIKIIKKDIVNTMTMKEALKSQKKKKKKYRHIDKLDVEIVNEFIDKILIGHYDKETNSRDIRIIWNFKV